MDDAKRKRLEQLALDAGLIIEVANRLDLACPEFLSRFAEAIREDDAQKCDRIADDVEFGHLFATGANECAKAIRAGET